MSFPCAIFFKKGFLDSSDGGLVTIGIAGRGGLGSEMVGGSGGATGGGAEGVSFDNSWLSVGVIASGPSSSDELSSPRFSNCSCNCRSRSFAASTSARWAARRASRSLTSRCASFLRFFSSSFRSLPCCTCSSSARKRAWAASRSLTISSSCLRSSSLLVVSTARVQV